MKYKIELKNITKYYNIKNKINLRDILLHPFKKTHKEKILALNNINLKINTGESLGIIGTNGAGKTTLLKILSNIIPPSSGVIDINGKVTSLIELGVGFNPELTGVENIYLSTSFYGINKKNTDKILNSIIEFSELENFINLPIKYYSTGMTLRLGFSIASNLNPDILIIDEILAVGDEYFQHKCINKILDLKSTGTTLIMVSHNLNLLYSLSDTILWLNNGNTQYIGKKTIALKKYLDFIEKKELTNTNKNNYTFEKNKKIKGCIIKYPIDKIIINFPTKIISNSNITLNINIITSKSITNVIIGFAIHTIDGFLIYGTNTKLYNKKVNFKKGNNNLKFKIPDLFLNTGIYTLSIDIHSNEFKKIVATIFKQIKFKVVNKSKKNDGPVIFNGKWSKK